MNNENNSELNSVTLGSISPINEPINNNDSVSVVPYSNLVNNVGAVGTDIKTENDGSLYTASSTQNLGLNDQPINNNEILQNNDSVVPYSNLVNNVGAVGTNIKTENDGSLYTASSTQNLGLNDNANVTSNNSFVEPNKVDPVVDQNNVTEAFSNPVQVTVIPEKESVGSIPPNKTEKKGMNKILFVILILVLIFGVGFGIYYFLSLYVNKSSVEIYDKVFNIYDEIPSDINEYAKFSNVETENCSIDILAVDNKVIGNYTYSITCEEETYEATIQIVDNRDFLVETNDLVLFKNSEVSPEDFVVSSTKEETVYSFVNETEVTENLSNTGGPFEVNILSVDNAGNELTVTANYYVILAYFEAESDNLFSNTLDEYYTITDRFYIGTGNLYMSVAYRFYTYVFDEETYNSYLEEYLGEAEFDGLAGELIFNDEEHSLTVKVTLTSETLDLEYGADFPDEYSSINSYYKEKDYNVSVILK